MPLSGKSKKMERSFEDEYGAEKGKRVFYATLNKGINRGKPYKVAESKRLAGKRKHKHRARIRSRSRRSRHAKRRL